MISVIELISRLGLEPLPEEGGYYSRSYYAPEEISGAALPERYDSPRRLGSAIYYLLTDEPDCFSALHLLNTDEIFHFYLGDPIEVLLLYPDGSHQIITMGQDLAAGQHLQYTVPYGVWQGARLAAGGAYGLMGTTMAPAYEQKDFILGKRKPLQDSYPARSDLIAQLTRE